MGKTSGMGNLWRLAPEGYFWPYNAQLARKHHPCGLLANFLMATRGCPTAGNYVGCSSGTEHYSLCRMETSNAAQKETGTCWALCAFITVLARCVSIVLFCKRQILPEEHCSKRTMGCHQNWGWWWTGGLWLTKEPLGKSEWGSTLAMGGEKYKKGSQWSLFCHFIFPTFLLPLTQRPPRWLPKSI